MVDFDITGDSIQHEIVRRENGIDSCVLRASDTKGAEYLAKYKLYDEITVRFFYQEDMDNIAAGGVGLDATDEEKLAWKNAIKPIFKGKIVEIDPSLDKNSQVCKIIAFGQGFQLREMRVNADYESFVLNTPLTIAMRGDNFVANNYTWNYDNPNDVPWIYNIPISPLSELETNILDSVATDIYVALRDCYKNDPIGPFLFDKLEITNAPLTSCHLHIIGKVDSANTTAECEITVYVNGIPKDLVTKVFSSTDYKNYYGDILPNILTTDDLNNLSVSMCMSNYTSESEDSQLKICSVYVLFESTGIHTIKEILAGQTGINGMIKDYVDNVLIDQGSSGYPVLDTTDVHDDSIDLGSAKFPYQDALMCLQELIKLYQAARIQQYETDALRGLHWIVDVDGYLRVQLIGLHDTLSESGPWKSRKNDLIIVHEDMITQTFKTELPSANLVLVGGRSLVPSMNKWCGQPKISDEVKVIPPDAGTWVSFSTPLHVTITVSAEYTKFYRGPSSIRIRSDAENGTAPYADGQVGVYLGGDIDFSKLISLNHSLTFNFAFMAGGSSSNRRLRLYTYSGSGDAEDYFEWSIDKNTTYPQDMWTPTIAELTKMDINNVGKTKYNGAWSRHGSPDIRRINFIGFNLGNTHSSSGGIADIWIDDLNIEGYVIRGASAFPEDSEDNPLPQNTPYGVRTLTIKDSIALSDTLNLDDDSGLLAKLALYELMRHCKSIITGKILLPYMATEIMVGMIVTLQTDQILNPDGISHIYDFRVLELRYLFSKDQAVTELTLIDDLLSSVPRTSNISSEYNKVIKATDTDFQTKTNASLKTGGDFDIGLKPIIKNYSNLA